MHQIGVRLPGAKKTEVPCLRPDPFEARSVPERERRPAHRGIFLLAKICLRSRTAWLSEGDFRRRMGILFGACYGFLVPCVFCRFGGSVYFERRADVSGGRERAPVGD